MQPQQLLTSFFFLLIALFLKELVFRMTRPLVSPEVRYFDFVRRTLFSSLPEVASYRVREALSIVLFSIVYGVANIFWLGWVWIYFDSFDKIVVFDFFSFLVHFWLMLFIAISIFVGYWVFGLFSIWYFECAVAQGRETPFKNTYGKGARDHQRNLWWYYRLLPWSVLFIPTLITFLLHLLL